MADCSFQSVGKAQITSKLFQSKVEEYLFGPVFSESEELECFQMIRFIHIKLHIFSRIKV